jgi:hypothetical protein
LVVEQGLLGLVEDEDGMVRVVDPDAGFVRVVCPSAKPGASAKAAATANIARMFILRLTLLNRLDFHAF